MTKEKAIEVLEAIKGYANGDDWEALSMGIDSIENDYARGVLAGARLGKTDMRGGKDD